MVHIITDSTSDLTVQEAEALNVRLIHMRVIFEDGVYTDGVDITKEEFYAKQAEAKVLPKTTQLNPQEYCDAFQPLLENGDEVVAILISSKLSGSFQSACIAKEMLDGGERLHLVDSLNVTIGEGLLVREAVRICAEVPTMLKIPMTARTIPRAMMILAVKPTGLMSSKIPTMISAIQSKILPMPLFTLLMLFSFSVKTAQRLVPQ